MNQKSEFEGTRLKNYGIRVFADGARLNLDGWNMSLGNKIQHILYVLKLCEINNFKPIIPCKSNLDNLFDWKEGIREDDKSPPVFYKEETAFSGKTILEVISLSERQFQKHKSFLLLSGMAEDDFAVQGHFWHYELMPSIYTVEKFLGLKQRTLDRLNAKYPSLIRANFVAVHFRGTDFKRHLKKVFPKSIMLDDFYYRKAIDEVEKYLGKNVQYHLFSDELKTLTKIFKDKNFIIHSDNAYADWTAMFLMKNIISSNSSFAWTASLYNKNFIIQPYCGYNYHEATGPIPYGFEIPGSIQIRSNEKNHT